MEGYNKIYFKPDVINRQEVNTLVDELEKAISYERSFMSIGRSTGEIMHDIRNLQSVTPQPNIGHWIEGNYHIRCSECGEDYTYSLRNYCPNCGAKMVKSQAESEE